MLSGKVTLEPFVWGTGTGAKSKGRATRARFRAAGHWVAEPVLEVATQELQLFLQPRWPGARPARCPEPPMGTVGVWFVVPFPEVAEPARQAAAAGWEEAYSGTNLYCLDSIRRVGWKATPGSMGRTACWCHRSGQRRFCGSYMLYVPSGTGVAWGCMLHLLVDRSRALPNVRDQWCQPEGTSIVRAVCVHGVLQKDWWDGMRILPSWQPHLEVAVPEGAGLQS